MSSSQQIQFDGLRIDHSNKLQGIGFESHAALEDEIARMKNAFNAILQDQNLHQHLDKRRLEVMKDTVHELNLANKQSKRNIITHSKIRERVALFGDYYPPGHSMHTGALGVAKLTEDCCLVGQKVYSSAIEVVVNYAELKRAIDKLRTLADNTRVHER